MNDPEQRPKKRPSRKGAGKRRKTAARPTGRHRRRFDDTPETAGMHLKIGWWTLAVFVGMGIVLESLHGFKLPWYLNVGVETRRTMLMMTHATGTLLGLLHVFFAVLVMQARAWSPAKRVYASYSLVAASLFIPSGFALAGIFQRDGTPGMGITLLVPGLLLLLIAISIAASNVSRATP